MNKEDNKKPTMQPATTDEARELQMAALAVDCVEKRMREGKASASEYVYYLKIASDKERMEKKKLEEEIKLLRAKTEAYESSKRVEELYAEAIKAIGIYQGRD